MKSHLAVIGFILVTIASTTAEQAKSLQDLSIATIPLPTATIFTAKEIVTLDPHHPKADAVAVVGDRILAVGSLEDLKKATGDQPFMVDHTFAKQVILPGFIGQHDHPLLAGLTMISEIISIEDWVLPSGTVPAAKNREDYLKRLTRDSVSPDHVHTHAGSGCACSVGKAYAELIFPPTRP
ncbi:MAG: imidazolonepropionase-like domain-containing protein [Luteolibacter sp.]